MNRSMSLAAPFVLAALMSTAPALGHAAAGSANVIAEISKLTLELVDLRPDDGVTPWITFSDDRYFGQVGSGLPYVYEETDSAGALTLSQPGGTATAFTDASTVRSTAAVSDYQQRFLAQSFHARSFTLSPWSTLKITAIGSASASRAGIASAYTDLAMGLGQSRPYEQNALESHQTSADWLLSMSVSTDDQALSGYFSAASGTQITSGVPEPSTYGMLLAGIGIIGAAVRRKQRG